MWVIGTDVTVASAAVCGAVFNTVVPLLVKAGIAFDCTQEIIADGVTVVLRFGTRVAAVSAMSGKIVVYAIIFALMITTVTAHLATVVLADGVTVVRDVALLTVGTTAVRGAIRQTLGIFFMEAGITI